MENITLLVKTNSSYSYLWPIIDDYVNHINIHKILAFDEKLDNLPSNFNSYIKYDKKLNFGRRLIQILNKITHKYVLFVPDVDLIINLNTDILLKYLNLVEQNNIDKVQMCVFNGTDIILNDNYGVCNLNSTLKYPSNQYYPIDCGPCLWKKDKFLELFEKFPNSTYNCMDLNKDIINYCIKNFKCYGIQYTNNLLLKYNRGLTYSNDLSFLHITTKGKILLPLECYFDYKEILHQILEKYNINIDKIGTAKATRSCLIFNKLKL